MTAHQGWKCWDSAKAKAAQTLILQCHPCRSLWMNISASGTKRLRWTRTTCRQRSTAPLYAGTHHKNRWRRGVYWKHRRIKRTDVVSQSTSLKPNSVTSSLRTELLLKRPTRDFQQRWLPLVQSESKYKLYWHNVPFREWWFSGNRWPNHEMFILNVSAEHSLSTEFVFLQQMHYLDY